ncbi:Uncharacterised protein [Mycobacteroides abscessus]|nr:Uncharacterised protein [Mycobacteroides abscessus]
MTPAGHASRCARASSPAARITACVIPEAAASRKNSSKKRLRIPMPRRYSNGDACGASRLVIVSIKWGSPAARTKCLANGSSIKASGRSLSTARWALTPSAVYPTLDTMSQESPSLRAQLPWSVLVISASRVVLDSGEELGAQEILKCWWQVTERPPVGHCGIYQVGLGHRPAPLTQPGLGVEPRVVEP